tara:strand:+ start:1106 stop:2686 length:1581 start_codon:yes stop_codon:yes gene_type:complete
MSDIFGCISRFSDIIKGLKYQINETVEIKQLMHKSLPTFLKALNRMNRTLEMLSYVFQRNSPHNELFKHKLLKFSQIETIVIKLEPMDTLLRILRELKDSENLTLKEKLKKYYELFFEYRTPSTLHMRMKKYFKIIEEALPVVIELNRTIFGSALRIKQPLLRKAWMLAGENQLNDSSLPINIVQDNLYMLLKLEIDENTINKKHKKEMYKNIISQITDDIDNRGATKGDGNISLAELNDLPDEVMENINEKEEYEEEEEEEDIVNEIDGCGCFGGIIKSHKIFVDDTVVSTNTNSCKSEDGESVMGDECIILATDFFDRYKLYLKKKKQKQKQKQNKPKNKEEPNYELIGISELLNETESDIEENIKVDVEIELLEDAIVKYNITQLAYPKCVNDYGHDFIAKKISKIVLKEPSYYNEKLNNETSILTKIAFQMIVKDQGWGGTGQAHVRYQINNNKCIKAFTVSRNEKDNPKNKYRFIINGYELNKSLDNKKERETEVSIWLYCPPWTGWEVEAKSITCEFNYN